MQKYSEKELRVLAEEGACRRLEHLDLIAVRIGTSGYPDDSATLLDLLRDVADGYLTRRDIKEALASAWL